MEDKQDAPMPPAEEGSSIPADEDNKEDAAAVSVPGEKPGQPISDLVNQTFAAQIMSMGYTKEVAEKSLLMTGNGTVDKAMDWIMEHQNDEDFFEEMRIESASTQDPNKPQLSKEEKLKLLDEKLAKVRAQKKIEEEKNAREAEINRIKFNKELLVAKRKMEEQQDEIQYMKQKKEREEFDRAKKEMQAQLLRDK